MTTQTRTDSVTRTFGRFDFGLCSNLHVAVETKTRFGICRVKPNSTKDQELDQELDGKLILNNKR